MSDAEIYWVWCAEQPTGPFSRSRVLSDFSPDTWVSNGDQWVRLADHPGFAAVRQAPDNGEEDNRTFAEVVASMRRNVRDGGEQDRQTIEILIEQLCEAKCTAADEKLRAGDVNGAMAEWMDAAAVGFAKARFNLGALHHQLENLEESERWLKLAAEQGHLRAQCNLGILCAQDGREDEARIWLQKAAMAGDANAGAALRVLQGS